MTDQIIRQIFNDLKPATIFKRLYACYGPQGWWPLTPIDELVPKYHPDVVHHVLNDIERWEIIVGSILTQNTTWHNAEQSLIALSHNNIRSPQSLYGTKVEDLAELIRPSRYYNQKAERLRNLAAYIIVHHKGNITSMLSQPTEPLRLELLALKGIGPETADSILLYAGQHPSFVIDAFTRRICSRLGWVEATAGYTELQTMFMSALPRDFAMFSEYHALLVRHAVERCRVKPNCVGCCLRRACLYPMNDEKK